VARQSQLWGETYRRPMAELITVQTSLATEIATTLRARLTPDEITRAAGADTRDVQAYQFYLKGLYNRQKTTELGFTESLKYFQQAIDLDPTYAQAYVGLSDSYGSLGYLNMLPPREVWPKARAAAEAALRLDDTLGEAHAALGHAVLRYDWDLARAEAELSRAIALNPRHAVARHWNAHLASAMGRFAEVVPESRKAVELEPLDLMLNAHLLFMLTGRANARDELMARIASVREIEPDFWAARAALASVHLADGQREEGVRELEASVAGSNRMPLALFFAGRALAVAGLRANAREAVAELEQRAYVPSVWVASIHAALGDRDTAFRWLERGFRERDAWLIELRSWPLSYQVDPRFKDLVRRTGLQS
jgi:tetratricopeptide (TPR) repeat protein